MNPLAQSLNEQLQQSNATAFTMLSDLRSKYVLSKRHFISIC